MHTVCNYQTEAECVIVCFLYESRFPALRFFGLNVSCLAEVKHAYQPIGMLMKDDVLEVISYKIRKLRELSSYASLFIM
jgi:hypothetical protein